MAVFFALITLLIEIHVELNTCGSEILHFSRHFELKEKCMENIMFPLIPICLQPTLMLLLNFTSQGDSGGPLVAKGGNEDVQVGVVSWGIGENSWPCRQILS